MEYNRFELNEKLGKNKKAIIKDVFILGAGAVFIGVGTFGAIQFGQELIEYYNSGEQFTWATKFAADWNEAKVGLSLVPVAWGGIASFKAGKELRKDLQYRKTLKNKRNIK